MPNEPLAEITDGEQLIRKIIEPYKGKVVYLDVWGTWCGPCKDMMQYAGSAKKLFEGKDVIFLYLCNHSSDKSWKNIIKEYGQYAFGNKATSQISGIVPGVMAQTGMESGEIVRGVIEETKPDIVIVVDALAARSVKRLNRTIQITDTGINPGSGVGNHRHAINKESMGIPVIAIGIPTVVDAATIVSDTMSDLIGAMRESAQLKSVGNGLAGLDEIEKHELARELLSPHLNAMFVTPKDIDEAVKRLSYTISEGLNLAFSRF